jgi:prophage regulatory protein
MQLLSIKDVVASTRLGRSTIYRKVGEGTFPPPLQLSVGCVRWSEADLVEWFAKLRPANDNRLAGEEAA